MSEVTLPRVLAVEALRALYRNRRSALLEVVERLLQRIATAQDRAIFISPATPEDLRQAAHELLAKDPAGLPLWGIPFAVKDNIDVEGFATTAACPAFAYRPQKDAETVARLKAAGALVIGKTNLDQFATGLNGTRSPYGAPRCVFDAGSISGGSSSGSAVAVATGLASFALGTDTAGSGRVPAAINNIVGIKPTPGLLSLRGVVPANPSLDCVSILALSVADGVEIRRIAEGYDREDPFSMQAVQKSWPQALRIGVLMPQARFFDGDEESASLYEQAIERVRGWGAEVLAFDYHPFQEIGKLLYDGPWLAERVAAIGAFTDTHPAALDPCVRVLLDQAHRSSAVDAFAGLHRLQQLRRVAELQWEKVDGLLLPTVPAIYTIEAMRAEPLTLNARLGYYTNFTNFLGCSAIAVPAGFKADGLPFGVTLVAPPFHDEALSGPAGALHAGARCGAGVDREARVGRDLEGTND